MLDFSTPGIANAAQAMELILIEAGQRRFAIRASSIKRLQRIKLAELEAPAPQAPRALCGYLKLTNLPIFDLTILLGLETSPVALEAPILIASYGNRQAGFIVEQTHEVKRAGLNELDVLPRIVEQARLRPAAWALWRNPEVKDQIIILIEPTECLTAEEWNNGINKG